MATVTHPSTQDLASGAEPRGTHEVFNQASAFEGFDLYRSNVALTEAVEREGAGWIAEQASQIGVFAGGAEAIELSRLANENVPVLRTHDRFGNRIDQVDYHPAYHRFMEISISHGLHCLPWTERPGGHAARAAAFMTISQAEGGHGCPISMTCAVVPSLRKQAELAAAWEPLLFSRVYDARRIAPAEKNGVTCGMSFTEKQGGSDLRANTTRGRPLGAGGAGGEYELTGHKWFCSAPMSDMFLITALTPEGISCFLLPRVLPDGSRNRFHIQRLKDKLGNRSNASAEIELDGAWAQMVGEPGRGVATVVEMINQTRLDCTLGSAAGMRSAVALSTHHCAGRAAFGKPLIEQPLMRNVLADLCVESEAATVTAMRLARAYDEAGADTQRGEHDTQAQLFRRLATAVAKYWTCKRGPAHAAEALECLGGNGYVEESGMPRLYREMPVNSAWEGSGNVMCLDVLRAMVKQPACTDAFIAELELAGGADQRLDMHLQRVKDELSTFEDAEPRARRIVENMALALQGSLLVRHSPPAVADAFCASRLGADGGLEYGTLPAGCDFAAIIERHRPQG
ncbi:MAG TPA: acyl-CoA dehydrogenase family protein [Solirubrobacteraceae bacterium]